MTLTELAAQATELARKTDGDSVTFAKASLRRRLQTLWNQCLWKSSLRVVTVAVTPETDALHAEGILLMPHVIERVCGVRSGDWPLVPAPMEAWSRTALDEFTITGTPQSYTILKPVVWAWASSTGGKPFVETASADDVIPFLNARYLDSSGVLTRNTGVMPDWFTAASEGFSNAPYTLPSNVVELQALIKPASAGSYYLRDTSASGTLIATVLATETTFPTRARIRLVNPPARTLTLKVLGKDRLPYWEDNEESPLYNSDDILVALAKADLFERFRQGTAAANAVQEAGVMLKQLMEVETLQEATRYRLNPEPEGVSLTDEFAAKGYW